MRQVILPTALVLLLCNMDRICMSVAILPIAKEMAWAPSVQVGCCCMHRRSQILSCTWPAQAIFTMAASFCRASYSQLFCGVTPSRRLPEAHLLTGMEVRWQSSMNLSNVL